ncbi:S-adenosyl-L-methionine-dependent methyltransferase [Dipodascopsis uninucleata]
MYLCSTEFSADELNHFNALASTWWDVHGSSRLLHKMNDIRISFMFDTIDTFAIPGLSPKNDLKVLDVGCGGGILTESLARHKRVGKVTGIDMSDKVISVAKDHKLQDPDLVMGAKLDYKLCSLFDLPSSDIGSYDAITLFEVLEHVPNPSALLEAATSRIRPGGWLFASTVNRTALSYLTTIFIGEKILNIVPEGTHTWSKYINESELRNWFIDKNAGWDVVQSKGCVYMPFIGWKFCGSRDMGNYFLAARRSH